jgi:hypothetical protein
MKDDMLATSCDGQIIARGEMCRTGCPLGLS